MLTIKIQNLRGLHRAEWQIQPLTCVIGPNGSGKTTLVLAMRFLRAAWDRTVRTAILRSFGTHIDLRNRDACADEPIAIEISEGSFRWLLSMHPVEGGIPLTEELLTDGNETVVYSSQSGETSLFGFEKALSRGDILAIKLASQLSVEHPAIEWIAQRLSGMHAFLDYRIDLIRDGAILDENRHLASNGRNLAVMLRAWLQTRADRFRYDEILEAARDAFPEHLSDLDFQESGQALLLRFYRPDDERGFPASTAAQGHLSFLISAAALASTPAGGIVALDEPEIALHPSAIGELVSYMVRLATQRGIHILITSHSPALLNCLNDELPGSVVRLRREAPQVIPLEEDFESDWLSALPLGRRLEYGQLGSNKSL